MARRSRVNSNNEGEMEVPNVRKKTRETKIKTGTPPTPKLLEVKKIDSRLEKFIPTPTQQEFIHKIENNIVTFVYPPTKRTHRYSVFLLKYS